MKTIIFILLLIPFLGLAQSGAESLNSFRRETFNLKEIPTKPIEGYHFKATNHPNTLVASNLNLDNENKMLLDSFYLYCFEYPSDTITVIREYYEYDNHGNQTLFAKYIPCETCAVGTHKVESSYDEAGRLSMYILFNWDYNIKQWIRGHKEIYSYELNGSLINESRYWWDEKSGVWKGTWKIVKSYDEHGNILSEIYFRTDENTGMWISSAKYEYSYNNEKRILNIYYKWDEEASRWMNVSKEESEFDVNGNETVHSNFIWENSTNQWVNNSKVIMTDSPETKMISYTQYRWDTIITQWINVHKEDYTFDGNGNEILKIYWNWDKASSQWRGEFKIESIYDDKGLMTSRITDWGSFDGSTEWIPRNKEDFAYDAEGNKILITTHFWRSADKVWFVSNKSYYYYSLHDLSNSVDVKETLQVKLYPNPVQETFTLEINDRSVSQCQLFNSKGQLIKTLPVEMGVNTVNFSNLQNGLYLVKIKTDKVTIIRKIVKN